MLTYDLDRRGTIPAMTTSAAASGMTSSAAA